MRKLSKPSYPQDYYVDVIPEICPFCNRTVDFSYNWMFEHEFEKETLSSIKHRFVDIIFTCPSPNCQRLTIYSYREIDPFKHDYTFENYYISETYYNQSEFPKTIDSISPDFVKIYNQALKAESLNLTEIIGLAYRKAFEFLIKDFIIYNNPNNDELHESVKNEKKFEQLLLKHFEHDGRIQSLSRRVAWLGNDEAHYLKLRSDHDVGDMKILIHLVVNYIDSDIESNKMINEIKPLK